MEARASIRQSNRGKVVRLTLESLRQRSDLQAAILGQKRTNIDLKRPRRFVANDFAFVDCAAAMVASPRTRSEVGSSAEASADSREADDQHSISSCFTTDRRLSATRGHVDNGRA